MNRTAKALSAALLALGLAVFAVPAAGGDVETAIGSTGCCKV
ncbi:hypothetical protein [Cellulomonas bogoriensis]|nr:hypothetical protein [Cellulomonas bogoriensis]